MSKVYLQVKDVDEFFIELHLKCKHKNSYSLLDIIQEMSVTFDEVEKWVKSNANWLYTLELCLELCYLHIQDDELSGQLSEEKALYYLQQNQSVIKNLQ